ncbi:endophilin-B1-like [Convolutriloba macropyga]|uniref:endophilin-B1-like n=1 Tax=Convolutriloba macropyga TaxID=536237 RepID=UPI003F5230EF
MSFGDSMGTMFNRAKQLASESLSDGVKTEYEPEVIILIGQLEKTREWTKRFLERQMELIQPNPALRAESFFHETFDLKVRPM